MRLGWLIGGAQGAGVDTAANIFGAAVAKSGYYIFGSREYFSNIKGRHSYFNVLISDKQQYSVDTNVNILATFDAETIFQHFDQVTEYMIYDKAQEQSDIEKVRSLEPEIAEEQAAILKNAGYGTTVSEVLRYLKNKNVKTIPLDYSTIIRNIINELKMDPFSAERARNMVSVGASFSLLGLDMGHMESSIERAFSKKKDFLELNLLAARAGMKEVTNAYSVKNIPYVKSRIQLDGNTISALGKIYGGLRFQSYYPITPASDESTYLEANQILKTNLGKENSSQGIIVVQTEDELAAINAAVGATLTGSRAATATSGPGFSLMNEGISWAGMNEAPVLITYYMRGSPATGLPTRSGQSDLKLALNAGHGEFARIVIASGDHMEIFEDAVNALNLAETCQTPAVHIIEKTLANSYAVIDEDKLIAKDLSIKRGKVIYPEDPEHYRRFEITEDGISPRAFLGHAQIYYTGDEHNENGHISESSKNRTIMYEKRIKKLNQAATNLDDSKKINIVGNADVVLLTWGSPKGAIVDSIDMLAKENIRIEMVQIRLFSPYPLEQVKKAVSGKKKIIAVENNYDAQGAEIFTEQTGIKPTNYILKWNGRPIYRDELIDAVRNIINKNVKRVVLNGGK
ncbi:MAG: 2-oxoacid:acceptor oxidoreductase subunit alpha [Candidatus Marsarchaeota archaeon]|nr:2-oxoacid:acceptor oxidoreductase subunit alpha [Candidatus Marsarchaeota archaeon]